MPGGSKLGIGTILTILAILAISKIFAISKILAILTISVILSILVILIQQGGKFSTLRIQSDFRVCAIFCNLETSF